MFGLSWWTKYFVFPVVFLLAAGMSAFASPDLLFTSEPIITSSTTVYQDNATIVFSYTERNNAGGSKNNAGPHTNRYYLSTDLVVGGDTEILPSYRVADGLAAKTNLEVVGGIGFTITPGTYYLLTILDADGEIAENDETNNSYIRESQPIVVLPPPTSTPTPTQTPTLPPEVTPTATNTPTFSPTPTYSNSGPDLMLLGGLAINSNTSLPSSGGILSVSFVETNNGIDPQSRAETHTNRFYLSQDTIIGNGDDTQLTPVDYVDYRMNLGTARGAELYLNIPAIPGDYYLYLSIDDDNETNEWNESNNQVMVFAPQIIVGDPPTPTPTSTNTPTLLPEVTPSPTQTPTVTPTPTATPTMGITGPDLQLTSGLTLTGTLTPDLTN